MTDIKGYIFQLKQQRKRDISTYNPVLNIIIKILQLLKSDQSTAPVFLPMFSINFPFHPSSKSNARTIHNFQSSYHHHPSSQLSSLISKPWRLIRLVFLFRSPQFIRRMCIHFRNQYWIFLYRLLISVGRIFRIDCIRRRGSPFSE